MSDEAIKELAELKSIIRSTAMYHGDLDRHLVFFDPNAWEELIGEEEAIEPGTAIYSKGPPTFPEGTQPQPWIEHATGYRYFWIKEQGAWVKEL
jgi:hypothetical protein